MTEQPGIAVGGTFNADVLLALGGVRDQLRHLRAENNEAVRQAAYARIKDYLPLTGSTVLDANGNGVIDLGTPMFGRVWTVRNLMSSILGQELAPSSVPAFATASFPAAAAGSVGVPAGATITGYTAQFGQAATAQTLNLTLAITGYGTIVQPVVESATTGETVQQSFTPPLAASGGTTLSYPASLGSAPGTLTLFYTTPSSTAVVGWYIGVNVPGTTSGAPLRFTNQWRETQSALPARNTYTSDIHQLRYGEHLFAIITGSSSGVGSEIVANAIVLNEPMKVGIPTSGQN